MRVQGQHVACGRQGPYQPKFALIKRLLICDSCTQDYMQSSHSYLYEEVSCSALGPVARG